MKKLIPALLIVLALAPAALAADGDDFGAIWNDPAFKKAFIGGYGINADIEPRVTLDEVKILEKVRPLMASNPAEAETALRKAMKPDCSAILDMTLGGILYQQEKYPAALDSYRHAVEKFPSFRRAWRMLGMIHARDASYDAAIAAFTQMIELGGGDAWSYGLLGAAHFAKQDYQPAEAAFRTALLLAPENTEWRLGLTRCVYKQRKFEDAAALLDVLITRFPDKADFWLLQALTYLEMKRPLDAAANFEAVWGLGKATTDTLNTLGDVYVSESLMDLALRAYLRAIDLDPQQPISKPLRGAELLASRGAWDEARQITARIQESWSARLTPEEKRKVLKLEAKLATSQGRGDEGTARVLEEILKLDPTDGEALLLLGRHYARTNERDKALLQYERAASIDACECDAKLLMGQLLVQMGRYADALPLLRRAQAIKEREDVARLIEQVERFSRQRR